MTVALDGKADGRTATAHGARPGRTAGGMIEITSGLQDGDQVVVTTVVPANLPTGTRTRTGTGTGTGNFPGGGAVVVPKPSNG